jgi:hypothetical protein
MVSRYVDTAQAPSIEELKSMSPDLFAQADVNDFKLDQKTNDYSFELVLKNTGASALVKGNLLRVTNEGIEFKER